MVPGNGGVGKFLVTATGWRKAVTTSEEVMEQGAAAQHHMQRVTVTDRMVGGQRRIKELYFHCSFFSMSYFFHVCICSYTCMWVHMCADVHASVCAHGCEVQRTASGVVPLFL